MSNEYHEPQFRGCWIPYYVLELFEEGEINAKEMVLLTIIDSLSKGQEGCFATNAYLGERTKVSEGQAHRMVSHLKKLGLLKQTKFDGRRRWLIPSYGQDTRGDTKGDTTEESTSDRVSKNADAGSTKMRRQGKQKCGGRVSKNAYHNNKVYKPSLPVKENISTYGKNIASQGSQCVNKKKKSKPSKKSLGLPKTFERVAAAELRSILFENDSDLTWQAYKPDRRLGRRKPDLDDLAKIFVKLRVERNVPIDVIDDTLEWLRMNWGKKYVPRIGKIQDILDKWGQFQDARVRFTPEEDNAGRTKRIAQMISEET